MLKNSNKEVRTNKEVKKKRKKWQKKLEQCKEI